MSDLPLPAPRLSVTGHLTRLRSRLVRCVLAILLVFCALFPLPSSCTALSRNRCATSCPAAQP